MRMQLRIRNLEPLLAASQTGRRMMHRVGGPHQAAGLLDRSHSPPLRRRRTNSTCSTRLMLGDRFAMRCLDLRRRYGSATTRRADTDFGALNIKSAPPQEALDQRASERSERT